MTINKTNLKYFLLPLVSALFIVSLITLVFFTFNNNVLVDDRLVNNYFSINFDI